MSVWGIRLMPLALCVGIIGCGGDSSTDVPTPPPPSDQGFSGTYATQVTLVSNTCGPVTVQSLPTAVVHNRTTNEVTLTHGGSAYRGTVAADSSFATSALDIDVGDGFQYRVSIAGRFGNRTFTADATVDRSGGSGPCRYVAHWVGAR